jgi:MFS family permease
MSAPEMLANGRPFDAKRASRVIAILAGMALMVTYVETMVLPAFKQFYTFFDQTGGSFANITWILSAYLLVGVVVTPIFGKLGDLYGKKRLLLIAMGVYAVAVTVAGFTPNIGDAFGVSRPNQLFILIGVRAVQGVGMAMFPLGFAMIPEVFPPRRVGQAQGIVAGMFAVGAALGLVGGGYIAQTYGWQLTYHTVIPAAILLLILGALLLTESPFRSDRKLDLPGVTSLGIGLATFMLAITEGAIWGWGALGAVSFLGIPWGVPQFFIVSVLAFAFFVWWEPRAKSPVIEFKALKQRNILIANINGLLVGMVMFFVFTAFTILVELPYGPGFNESELTMGLLLLPAALGMLICGPILGRAISRVGPKPIMTLGFGLIVLGSAFLILFNRTLLDIAILPIPLLVGSVAVLISMTNVIVLSVDRRELGVQTGMNLTFRNLGSAIAPVATSTILASFTASYLGGHFTGYSLEGFQIIFGLMAVMSVAGLLLSLASKNFRFGADGVRQETSRRHVAAAPEAPAVSVDAARP